MLLNAIDTKPLDAGAEPVQKPANEKRNYSFLRALSAASRNDWSNAGFEAEMSAEVAHKRGKQPQGFYVPDFAWGQRELTVGTNASGGFFAPSVQLSSEWINALRAKMVLPGLGMRIMSGLQTKIQIPKLSAGATASFVSESGAVGDIKPKPPHKSPCRHEHLEREPMFHGFCFWNQTHRLNKLSGMIC